MNLFKKRAIYLPKNRTHEMNLKEIAIKRLYSQHILNQRFKSPSELVSWLGAMQGQDYAGAKWAVGLRLPGINDEDVEKALKDRILVRTWVLRGTLHFVAGSDVHWLLELLAPRIIARNARRYRELELDEKTLYRSNNILKNALSDNNQLNRRELLAILEKKGISTEGQRAPYMLQRASIDGLICQGVTHLNNPIYMSMDELPRSRTMEREDALAELAKRYFNGHGPATLKDFVWWSGLLVNDAKAGLELIKHELEKEIINGKTYWLSSNLTGRFDSPKVNLLPWFDEFLLSYRDRSASIGAEQVKQMLKSTNGMLSSTIILDGRVVGKWKRTIRKDNILLELKYFRTLNDLEKDALKSEILRYGEFIGLPVILK